jgi:SAM-dependent methyltransferase
MNRLSVLQTIIDHIHAKTYLEIGVETGTIISNIDAPNKIGVDPKFLFSKRLVLKKLAGIINFKAIAATSDIFFDKEAEKLLRDGIDVALVDGLHTYNQSLRDIKNCLRYLNPGGVIVVHDCNPVNYASAYPIQDSQSLDDVMKLAEAGELPGWNGSWNGDVWKSIAHLRITNTDLNVFTLDLDWGLGIISRGDYHPLTDISLEDLQKMDYYSFEKKRTELLNLKHPKYLTEFLKGIKKK